MKTISEFIKENGIKYRVNYSPENPYFADESPRYRMDHWKIVMQIKETEVYSYRNESGDFVNGHKDVSRRLTTYFSMGQGYNGQEPKLKDVLDCIASDSAGVEDRDFEEWADDYGYDTDSRKAERIYKNCVRQANKLKRFLGESLYNELLYEVERV